MPLSREAARSLVFEAARADVPPLDATVLAPALADLARLGAAFEDPRGPDSAAPLVGWYDEAFPHRLSVPLSKFAAIVADRLATTFGAETVLEAPLDALIAMIARTVPAADPYEGLVAPAFNGPEATVDPDAIAAVSRRAVSPRRASAKLMPVGQRDGVLALALNHFGGDAMSFALRYAHVAAMVEPNFMSALRQWFGRSPEVIQIVAPQFLRMACSRTATQAVLDTDELYVRRTDGGLVLARAPDGVSIRIVTGEVFAELSLPFAQRLGSFLGRSVPSALEGVLSTVGCLSGRRVLAAEHDAAVVLPRLMLGPFLQIAPHAVVLGPRTLAPNTDLRNVWRLLERYGLAPGPVEIRPLGRIREPAIADLRHPEGAAWLVRLAGGGTGEGSARGEGVIISALPPPHIVWSGDAVIVDFCLELRC